MASVQPIAFGDLSYLDTAGETITGTIKADTLTWDAWKGVATDPLEFTSLDGGAGNDSLTLKLTQEQFDNLLAEIAIDFPGVKVKDDGTLIADGTTFSGNNWVSLESLGLNVKMWENIKLEVVPDPEPEPHLEQLKVLDFEQDYIAPGDPTLGQGIFVQTDPIDWHSDNGLVEVQGGVTNYGGHTNFGEGTYEEHQYLDTAASAGNINITTDENVVDVSTGAKAHIDIAVAPQNLVYPANNQPYSTDPNASFELLFNDQVLKVFTMADFENNTVANQDFETFSFDKDVNDNDLIGLAGSDSITIRSQGQEASYTGFSIDHVVVSEWTL